VTSNPCAGLLRVRTAEAEAWRPMLPHFRAQLAGLKPSLLAVLPHVAKIMQAGPITYRGIACRLLILGEGTRRGLYNRQQPLILKDLMPLCRPTGRLGPLSRMAQILGGAR